MDGSHIVFRVRGASDAEPLFMRKLDEAEPVPSASRHLDIVTNVFDRLESKVP